MKRTSHALNRRSVSFLLALTLLAVSAFIQACGGASNKAGNKVTLILGGYTTPREAYGKAILPAFKKYWLDKTGQEVDFQESYQGSGAQSRAIVGGFEADIAALSLEGDIDKIAEAGLITHDWRAKPRSEERRVGKECRSGWMPDQ